MQRKWPSPVPSFPAGKPAAAHRKVQLSLLADDGLHSTELNWPLPQRKPQAPERAQPGAPCQPLADRRCTSKPQASPALISGRNQCLWSCLTDVAECSLHIITVATDNWHKVTKQETTGWPSGFLVQWPLPYTPLNLRFGFIRSCLWWQYNFNSIFLL